MMDRKRNKWIGIVVFVGYAYAAAMAPLTWPLNSELVFTWKMCAGISLAGFAFALANSSVLEPDTNGGQEA